MRIVIALLLVVVGCKTDEKSAADRAPAATQPAGSSPDPGSVDGTRGSSAVVGVAPVQPAPPTTPPPEPAQETPTTPQDPNAIAAQQAKVNAQLAAGTRSDFAVADGGVAPSDLQDVEVGSGGKGPPGKIVIASTTGFDKTNLSADAVAARVGGAYMTTLVRCYRNALARDGSIKGKATLDLTVKPAGSVEPKAATLDARLQACFTLAMAGWTFPVPKNADGDPTDAGFQITLTLTPE